MRGLATGTLRGRKVTFLLAALTFLVNGAQGEPGQVSIARGEAHVRAARGER